MNASFCGKEKPSNMNPSAMAERGEGRRMHTVLAPHVYFLKDPGLGVLKPLSSAETLPRALEGGVLLRLGVGAGIFGRGRTAVVESFGLVRTAEVGAGVTGTAGEAPRAGREVVSAVVLLRERAGDPTALETMEAALGAARVGGLFWFGRIPETDGAAEIFGLGLLTTPVGVEVREDTTLLAGGLFAVVEGAGGAGLTTIGLFPRVDNVLPLLGVLAPERVATEAFTTRDGRVDSHSAVTDDSRVLVGLLEVPGVPVLDAALETRGVALPMTGEGAPLDDGFAGVAVVALSFANRFSSALRAR